MNYLQNKYNISIYVYFVWTFPFPKLKTFSKSYYKSSAPRFSEIQCTVC